MERKNGWSATGGTEQPFGSAQEALLLIQVYADHYAQSRLDSDAIEDEVWAAREFLGLKVQAAATIEWEDEALQRFYEADVAD